MRRRELLLLLAATMTATRGVCAQQKGMPVIGYLGSASPSVNALLLPAFKQGLSEAGYVEGRNVAVEYRWAEDHYDRLPALAADLVSNRVDVIVSTGGITGALAAKNASSTIPIVFITGDDPVERGLVTSLARPGGNLTGVSFLTGRLMPKRLELVSELVPQIKVIALLINPNNASAERVIRDLKEAARAKEVELRVFKAGNEGEFDAAFISSIQAKAGAIVIGSDPFFFSRRDQLIGLAARYAIPAIYERREFAAAGGLISYGPSFMDTWRQAGIYAGKILKGAKPAELPVQQPTKFELVVNLKAAKAHGLTVPQSILVRADEVIE
jgi:putative tryptophan/tyrosine transport system substrate-binding protein